MDLTPKTHVLKALRRRGLTHADAFAELIDNSLDAKATRISIEMSQPRIIVTDNGRGVTASDVKSMLTIGEHGDGNDAGLGIYGVGFNLAALCLAGEVEIAGINRGNVVRAAVNWNEVFRAGTWNSPDPRESRVTEDERGILRIAESGTRVILSKLLLTTLSGQNFVAMCDRVRFMFTPALRAGMQIVIKPGAAAPHVLAAVELPPFDESVKVEKEVAGRAVLIRCGVVKDGHRNDFRGFAVAFRHRYIQKSALYCGDAPSARIAGEIVLLDPAWHADLSDTKSALVRNQDALIDAVREACADVFSQAAGQARVLRLTGLAARAEAIIREASGSAGSGEPDAKAKRAKRTETDKPPARPTGTGSKHKQAAKTQAGSTFAERARRGLRIEFAPLGNLSLGEPDLAAVRATLNLDNPHVQRLVAGDDASGTAAAAVSLLAHEQIITGPKQRVFAFASGTFSEIVGKVLAAFSPAVIERGDDHGLALVK